MKKIHISLEDYQLAKQALTDKRNGQSSASRIFAAMMGGSEKWSLIIELWEDALKQLKGIKGQLIGLTIDSKKSMTATIE